jgi:Glycosyl hydrolase family 1
MTVMLEGRYTDAYLAEAGGDSPTFTDDELKTISTPLDFVAINVYKPGWYIEPSDERPGYHDIPINASRPKMQSTWHVLDPEVMYWAPKQMQSISGAKSIFITENGCGASDAVAEDGRVYDSDRVMFLRACLGQLAARHVRRTARRRILPVERPGQLRVDGRLRQPVRTDLRRLRHPGADSEAQRGVVPRVCAPQRGCVPKDD